MKAASTAAASSASSSGKRKAAAPAADVPKMKVRHDLKDLPESTILTLSDQRLLDKDSAGGGGPPHVLAWVACPSSLPSYPRPSSPPWPHFLDCWPLPQLLP